MRKILTTTLLVVNSAFLVFCSIEMFTILLPVHKPGAIGIIGGADGPTAIIISPEFTLFGPTHIIVLFFVLFLFEITLVFNLSSTEHHKS